MRGRRWWTSILPALAVILLAGCTPLRRGTLPTLTRSPETTPPPATTPSSPGPAPRDRAPETGRMDGSRSPRELVCALAQGFQGVPYRYGGTTPDGFDCSGLACYVFREAGVTLPRTVRAQAAAGYHVSRANLLPGDLVFFRTEGRRISHVGIYVGEGRFVHAPSTGKTVRTDALDDPWWLRRYAGARRVLADDVVLP